MDASRKGAPRCRPGLRVTRPPANDPPTQPDDPTRHRQRCRRRHHPATSARPALTTRRAPPHERLASPLSADCEGRRGSTPAENSEQTPSRPSRALQVAGLIRWGSRRGAKEGLGLDDPEAALLHPSPATQASAENPWRPTPAVTTRTSEGFGTCRGCGLSGSLSRLAEGERVRLRAGIAERDLKRSLADCVVLARELVQAAIPKHAVSVLGDVDTC